MTLKEIQTALYEKLKPVGWGDKLKMFLLSDEFYQILETLWTQSQSGHRFTPILKDLFRAFEECPYKDLKVIMVGQDPYPVLGAADGIAFSCSTLTKPQPSLDYLLKEIDKTVYSPPNIPVPWDLDLKRWSNQGVLMLNTALTCEINKIGSHIELWRPFMVALFDMLNNYNTGIIYVFMGSKAKEWHKSIESTDNYKFFTTHPASAAYKGSKEWDSGNLFNQVNKLLYGNTGEKITW